MLPYLCGSIAEWYRYFWGDHIVIEYLKDGHNHREELLATENEADELASQVRYDGRDEAHIVVKHTLSFGTSKVYVKAKRVRARVLVYVCLILIDVESMVQHMLRIFCKHLC